MGNSESKKDKSTIIRHSLVGTATETTKKQKVIEHIKKVKQQGK